MDDMRAGTGDARLWDRYLRLPAAEKLLMRLLALVVAPISVCANWEAEIARFAPTLRTHRLVGIWRRWWPGCAAHSGWR